MGVVIGAGAVIGRGCRIYHGVTLGISHRDNDGFPVLGENVLVGAGAKILGPIVVGNGAKIGANSVVLSDVPAGASAIGVPARVVQ